MDFRALCKTLLILLCIWCTSINAEEKMKEKLISVIPLPISYSFTNEEFRFNETTGILIDKSNVEIFSIAAYLSRVIQKSTARSLEIIDQTDGSTHSNLIHLFIDTTKSNLDAEGYELSVSENKIILNAYKAAGLFRGIQTIRQLLPPEFEKQNGYEIQNLKLPGINILDKPKFPWRGMLLDCCRHFMDKEFVKRYINLLAYHKMNVLHWHLTEDQGWRIEIKKYPKLTEIGAWRENNDGTVYGGYYTQDDIREVVEYAKSRYITIVPEIEMPGHSVAAITSYPEYSCTEGQFEVANSWGVFKDVYCAGNDSTFIFLEDVLTEVMDLFPGTYIHIGGDEVPKDRWKECSKCQSRIEEEGLKDESELQSYFIKRIEKFLASKGKRLIGWDEILDGGLPPEATVQSWRGMDGAITAVRSGHDAIVSPTSHAYFDYDIATTNLEKVYSFNPIPPELTVEEQKHILGGECNMWTERAPQEKVDSKVFPRILAMAEVLWTANPDRNFDEFFRRVSDHYKRLDYLGVQYGPDSKPLSFNLVIDSTYKTCEVKIETTAPGSSNHFTLDGNQPDFQSTIYISPIFISSSTVLKVKSFKDNLSFGETAELNFIIHKAFGTKPVLENSYHERFTAGGDFGLTDGLKGSIKFWDGRWQGFEGTDLAAVIDLKKPTPIEKISVGFLEDTGAWIFFPTEVEFLISDDGEEFALQKTFNNIPTKNPDARILDVSAEFENLEARFIKIVAKNIGMCPSWHPGAGDKAWVFSDEIIIQ